MASFSDFLGYTSIACWLGAQFPQVLENLRRKSVEGLALPFLMNWLLGDITNLVGCILTRQLPFQTYLAGYFCFVDCTLLGQYIYYNYTAPPAPLYIHSRSRAGSTATVRRMTVEHTAPHYRTLSTVAANVAAAAALAAQQEEQSRWHRHSIERRQAPPPMELADEIDAVDDDVDEEALARLADSFHSEGGRSARRKTVSWSKERYGGRGASLGRSRTSTLSPTGGRHHALHMTTSPEEFDPLARGRPLSREVLPDGEEEEEEEWTASQRRSSRASRKGAGMVFLGAWALFGVGTLMSGGRELPPIHGVGMGQVLQRAEVALPSDSVPVPYVLLDAVVPPQPTSIFFTDRTQTSANEPPPKDGPSIEHIIGRVSAWICTTLYLTSRLPQIWKNFVRKSVEGLSVYLFIFAFLGNFFYVASILTSPKLGLPQPEASAFLIESIPYLLGSGGTLVFDVTIVTQTYLYRPKAYARGRRASRAMDEEEAGLLSADATGANESGTPSRRRMGAPSDDDRVER